MKKLISSLCLLVCMVFSTTVIYAEPTNNNTDFAELSKSIVEKHLTTLDTGEYSGEYDNVSDTLKEYLNLQVAVAYKHIKENDLEKYNYEIDTTVLETQVIDEVSYYKVNAKAKWSYGKSAPNSSYGKNIDILIDNQTGKVIDLYSRDNSMDIVIRGEVDIKDKEVRLNKEMLSLAQEKYGSYKNIANETQTSDTDTAPQIDMEDDHQDFISQSLIKYIVAGAVVLVVLILGAILIIKRKSK